MADFILKEPEYAKIPELLAAEVPEFLESDEFNRLDPKLRKNPGLVCAAFKDYFIRLQEAEIRGIGNNQMSAVLGKAYDVIEKLASSPDPEVQNAVITEILEHLWCSEQTLARIKQRLKPKSLALYNRWIS